MFITLLDPTILSNLGMPIQMWRASSFIQKQNQEQTRTWASQSGSSSCGWPPCHFCHWESWRGFKTKAGDLGLPVCNHDIGNFLFCCRPCEVSMHENCVKICFWEGMSSVLPLPKQPRSCFAWAVGSTHSWGLKIDGLLGANAMVLDAFDRFLLETNTCEQQEKRVFSHHQRSICSVMSSICCILLIWSVCFGSIWDGPNWGLCRCCIVLNCCGCRSDMEAQDHSKNRQSRFQLMSQAKDACLWSCCGGPPCCSVAGAAGSQLAVHGAGYWVAGHDRRGKKQVGA